VGFVSYSTPLCKLIETSNEYKLNNQSFLFCLVAGYKTSHAGTLVTNMTSSIFRLFHMAHKFSIGVDFFIEVDFFIWPTNSQSESIFYRSRLFHMAHKFSIGFASGEFPGQSRIGIFFSAMKFFTVLDV